MSTPPPNGRVIGYDPSAVGLPAAIGTTVYDAGGVISWLKYDTSNFAWRPIPVSALVTGDPSVPPGLKAQVGFVVTLNDGSKSWVKSSASDTDWVLNPTSGGGAAPTLSLDVSAMPTATGSLLTYMRTPGFAGPADSLMPQSSKVVGVLSGGKIISGTGIVSDLLFTTQGGIPSVGQTVCLAGSDEDLWAGQGKATALCPDIGLPFPDYLPNFQIIIRSRVEIGTVLDNSTYLSNGTAKVLLKLPADPQVPRFPAVQTQGWEAEPFSAGHNFEINGNQGNFAWVAGETFEILFTVENNGFGSNYLFMNVDDFNTIANGYYIREASGHFEVVFSNASTTTVCDLGSSNQPTFQFGLNHVIASLVADSTTHGASIHASLNGGPVVVTPLAANNVSTASGWKASMGRLWTLGGFVAIYKYARAFTDTELWTYASSIHPLPPPGGTLDGRWVAPAALVSDPSNEWFWRATDWTPSADPLGTPGPAAKVGSLQFSTNPSTGNGPGKQDKNESCYRDELVAHVLDTDPVGVDSLGYVHGRPVYDIGWTEPSGAISSGGDEFMVCWENDDFDGHDIMEPNYSVDGVDVYGVLAPASTTAVPTCKWVPLGPTQASHHVIVMASAFDEHGAASGMKGGFPITGTKIVEICGPKHAQWDTAATTSRMVVVDDGPMEGHDSSASSSFNSVISRLRKVYSGRVTHCANSAFKLSDAYAWGLNSMAAEARTIQACAAEGAPSSVVLYNNVGEFDAIIGFDTAATMATKYGQLLDLEHSLMPSATIWLQQFSLSHAADAETNPNTGQTMAIYETAIAGLTSGRAWLHFLDVRGPNALAYTGAAPQHQFIDNSTGSTNYVLNMRDNTNGGPVF